MSHGESPREYVHDAARGERIGMHEVVFCSGKSPAQICQIVRQHQDDPKGLFLTRLDPERHGALTPDIRAELDYDEVSATAVLGQLPDAQTTTAIAVVCAGTSDVPVAREAVRTLAFHGVPAVEINDVGVAGLWRLLERVEELRSYPVIIAIAGMDAALPTVLGGQVGSAIIGVPTSTGYGVAQGGHSALHSMLASCAPGLSVVNIDNGYGAACAALRILRQLPGVPD